MIEGLKEKVAIVTGGGHGIGKAYCLGFGRAGAHVVSADIDEPAAGQVASQVAKETGAQSLGLSVDVSDEGSTKAMAAAAIERFGRIDILVNNAAIFATIPINRGGAVLFLSSGLSDFITGQTLSVDGGAAMR